MFENVLVGVDGRIYGRDAIALAAQLAGSAGKLTLAHVRPGELRPLNAHTPGLLAEEREASLQLLERERADAGVQAQLASVIASSPGAGLHREAEEIAADLLVVGSCSRGTFGRATLGDDTRAALNGAPCAVAIAARGFAEDPAPPAKIGVAYNGSAESQAALAKARALAQSSGASVTALEVVVVPSYAFTGMVAPALGDSIDLMLTEANERLAKLPGVQGRAVYGLAGEELAAFGQEVDLLVVGSRGYGPFKRLVLGSTSDYLERHARCSLLVLPRMPEQASAPVGPRSDS
ncbi:MAG TPA: universal stress protein [Solirubrobacteraceae bacterium]|nr:universal stress protein [Solirubrobacteraceae bacterium]